MKTNKKQPKEKSKSYKCKECNLKIFGIPKYYNTKRVCRRCFWKLKDKSILRTTRDYNDWLEKYLPKDKQK